MVKAHSGEHDLVIRQARPYDLRAIVRMLADDPLGATREVSTSPLPGSYHRAFEAIDRDPNNILIVAEMADEVVGVLQLTFIPNITYQGGWRAQIEGVRISAANRSSGLGRRLFSWTISQAKQRGCHMIQLTADKERPEAIRFYKSLGFVASHEGLKLNLAALE